VGYNVVAARATTIFRIWRNSWESRDIPLASYDAHRFALDFNKILRNISGNAEGENLIFLVAEEFGLQPDGE
jgi:hypothetical protein